MELLVSVDLFGAYHHWYVNHKKKVYTSFGGILTLISLIIFTIVSSFYFKHFINRENPQITENDKPNYQYKKIKFGEEKIYIPWTIADYTIKKVNFTGYLYPIIYYFYGERNKETGTMPYNYKILNYKYCNETNLKTVNYFQDSYVDFDTLYCIDMEDLIMGGDWFHDFVYHIQMDFFLCEDGADIGTEGKKCTNDTKLNEIIGGNNAWHIEIYYPEIQFKPQDRTEPMQIFYNTHFYNFNKLNTKVERFYFKENIMLDDQGWIFENEKQTTFWGFEKMESDTYSRSSDGSDFIRDFSSSKIYSLVVYVSRNTKIFTRKYTKILDVIGNIMSVINGIFIIFKFISQFFTEAYQDREILDNILIQKNNMDEKFRKINENKKNIFKLLNSDNLIPAFNQKQSNEKFMRKSIDNVNNINNLNNINKSWNHVNNKNLKFSQKIDNTGDKIKNLKSVDLCLNKESVSDEHQISKNNIFSLNNIDNSSLINIQQNNLIVNKVNKNNLRKKILNKDNNSIDINNKLSLNKPKYFRFPYYLYLLNIFNKSFNTTKMCFIDKNFLDVWKYMVNIIDVTKFFQLQTNVDLINKILFELKIDGEKPDIKYFRMNDEASNY